jgi:hypothetical protein
MLQTTIPKEYSVKRYMSMQIREIREHQWYLSEQKRMEIDMDATVYDWANHHAKRFQEAYHRNIKKIIDTCKEKCNDHCQGVEKGCVLDMKEIHKLLGDN